MTISRYSTSLHNSLEFIPGSHKRSNKHYFKGISFELYWEIIVLHNKCCRSILPTMYPAAEAPGGKTSPCDYIRLGNISRERMVSVQNIDEGLIWGSVHIPILLSSTMVWIPWDKTAALRETRLTIITRYESWDFHTSSRSNYQTSIYSDLTKYKATTSSYNEYKITV